MQSLWLLTKKNLKLLLRAKSSALIVFFAPLLTILILGLSYNSSSQYGLNIGIYAPSYSDDVNSFISLLQEKEFRVITYDTSVEDCIDDIKIGAVHACISLPESLQIEGNNPKEVTFYLDASRINLVWMIQETIKTKFDFKAQQISQELTQEILSKLQDTQAKIGSGQGNLAVVKDKNSAASTSAESAKSSLVGLDFAAPAAEYDITVMDAFKTNLSSEITTGVDKVQEARNVVESTNISASIKEEITSILTAAEENLDVALVLVTGSGDVSLEKITGLVNAMQADVQATKAKLTSAADAVSASSTNLNTASASLSESLSSLSALESTLSEIQTLLSSQRVTDAGTITSPLVARIEKVSKESTYLNYSFPALLIVVVMFTSLILGTLLVMMEKNSPAFVRNYFLPVRKTTFVISIYLTNLALILVQIIIILGLSLLFLKIAIPTLLSLALVLFVSASVFTFLGMALGYIFSSEETGVLASISLGSLLLFLSGVVLPIETISVQLREAMYFSPFVLAEKIARELFIFDASLQSTLIDFLILIGYVVVLFLVILIIESVLHKHLMNKMFKHHQKLRQEDIKNKNKG